MAHVKIYGRRDVWQDRRGSVSDAVHRAIVGDVGAARRTSGSTASCCSTPTTWWPPAARTTWSSRSSASPGRSREARRALIAAFYDDVAPTLGLSADDLEVIIIESPPENWGIRGVSGDELSLTYRVDV